MRKTRRTVVVDPWIDEVLRRMADKYDTSAKGVLESLVLAMDGNADYGMVELDWGVVQKKYPSAGAALEMRWDKIVDIVVELVDQGFTSPMDICRLSRLTEKQVMKALPDALVKITQRKRKRG